MATHSSILPGESHGQRSLAGYSLWGRKNRTRLSDQVHRPDTQRVALGSGRSRKLTQCLALDSSVPSVNRASRIWLYPPGAIRETWVRSLGWEDPVEKGKATHSSILAWRITVHGVTDSRTQLSDFHFRQEPGPQAGRAAPSLAPCASSTALCNPTSPLAAPSPPPGDTHDA